MICEDMTGQGDRSRISNCPPFLMQHLFPGMRNSYGQQESDEEVPQMGQLVNFLFTVHDLKWEHAPNSHILPSLERISLSIYMGHKSEETEKKLCVEEVFSQSSLGTEQLHSEGDLFYFGTDIGERDI